MLSRGRITAAAIHLVGTAAIACLVYILVFHLWFKEPFDELAGAGGLLSIIIYTDAVLGPALTLVVFNVAKPRRQLFLDMAVIITIQFAALCYGLATSYAARPVALVFEVDRFRVITAADVKQDELLLAPQQFRKLPYLSIWLLGTRPSRGEELAQSVDMALGGIDIAQRPSYWQPYRFSQASALSRSKSVDAILNSANAQDAATLRRALMSCNLQHSSRARFLPVTSRFQNWIAILDEQGVPCGYANVNGF